MQMDWRALKDKTIPPEGMSLDMSENASAPEDSRISTSSRLSGQRFWKIILTVLFLFLAVSLIITWNTPSKGFESSIYYSTPLVLWIALVSSVIAGITLVVLSVSDAGTGSGILWKWGLLLIVLCYAICLGLFMIRGYFMWAIIGDPASHIGWINEILQSGHIPGTLFYPITHIFLSEISLVTTLDPIVLSKIVPLLFGLFVVLFIYIFVRFLSPGQIEPVIAVIISCTFAYGFYFYLNLTPNILANLFIPLVLFLMFRYLKSSDISWTLLFCIMLLLFPVFHPVPSVFIGLCLITLWIPYALHDLGTVFRKRDLSLLKLNRLINLKVIIPALILVIWFNFWQSMYSSWRWTILEMWSKIIAEGGTTYLSALMDQVSFAQGYGYNVVEVVLKQYSNPIILAIMTVIAVALLWKMAGRKEDPNMGFMLYGPWGAVAALIVIFYFLHLGFGPLRLVTYTAILGTVFAAYLLSYLLIRGRDSKKRLIHGAARIVVIVFLVGLFLSGMLNLYTSPYNMIVNIQTTHTEISGMNFFFDYRNVMEPVSGLTAAPGRFSQMLLTPEERTAQQLRSLYLAQKDLVPWHFGYDRFPSITFSYDRTTNLIITQRDKVIYTDYVPEMAKYRFLSRDFERLNHDSGASLIYSNGGYDLFTITPA
jgi:hypothetical protein